MEVPTYHKRIDFVYTFLKKIKNIKSGRIEKVKNSKSTLKNGKTKKKIKLTNPKKKISNKNMSVTNVITRGITKKQTKCKPQMTAEKSANNILNKINHKHREINLNKKMTKKRKHSNSNDKNKCNAKLTSSKVSLKSTNETFSEETTSLTVKNKPRKNPVTHQTLFFNKSKRNKNLKKEPTQKATIAPKRPEIYRESLKKLSKLPLHERMVEKLKAARFRYLNEQMYTNTGKEAKQYFDGDINAYKAYHDGYRLQVSRWPINPIDIIISKVKKLDRKLVVADFGCGDAKLAKSVPHKVHSFDLVATDDTVTACDMAHVPLTNDSVDVIVFCLSLMGTNLKEYFMEAKRVLKNNGLLKIAEVESRFEDINSFISKLRSYGFVNKAKDLSHNLFCFLDFELNKSKSVKNENLPAITLKPCLYKKR
ncbi:ribosomal RNA-processing protein 8 isoform X2 [Photinus pyralis]|uniref:ribosomal RNA-processing protein 8 isoform X2 n=1 Tax=Photinus pyralis TaxID=7054 RepID=UPI001266FA5B|nr:ribosomal RNA-processing protein 8 isoform X2 [Photinus pyralis]